MTLHLIEEIVHLAKGKGRAGDFLVCEIAFPSLRKSGVAVNGFALPFCGRLPELFIAPNGIVGVLKDGVKVKGAAALGARVAEPARRLDTRKKRDERKMSFVRAQHLGMRFKTEGQVDIDLNG